MAGKGEWSESNGHVEKSMEEGGLAVSSLGTVSNVSGEQQAGEYRPGSLSGDTVCGFPISVPFLQKIVAEVLGTSFLIFAGSASVTVNLSKGMVTFPGISIVWGLVVMVMVYSLGHISGAHFNPAVTVAFAASRRFPWSQVPVYVVAQVLGSTLASVTLRLLFGAKRELFHGTIPQGSDVQSLVLEFIITFYLMFVIAGVATDNRAIGELAGLAVGATVLLNALFAGSIRRRRWADDRRQQVRGDVGVHGGAGVRGGGGRLDLQPHPLHRQAPARDHQERLLLARPRLEDLRRCQMTAAPAVHDTLWTLSPRPLRRWCATLSVQYSTVQYSTSSRCLFNIYLALRENG